MADRLKNMKWENNASLFILINDSGSITPIYKRVEDVPQIIKNMYKNYPFLGGLLHYD